MLLKERAKGSKLSRLKIRYNPNALSLPVTDSNESVTVLRKIWDTDLMNIQEQVYVLFLNGYNQVICYSCLNTGTSRQTLFDIKLALACALGCLAGKVIIAHNHPSGPLKPSQGDIDITDRLKAACKLLEIPLLDHVIINRYDYYSFRDNGLL